MEQQKILDMRRRILNCQRCFEGKTEDRCRHHEDLVGGYQPHKVVFVGINPQGAVGNPFYEEVEKAPDEQKMLLGDHLLTIFAGLEQPQGLRHELFDEHPGRSWVERVAGYLGYTLQEFAEDVRLVELVKHATADQRGLVQLGPAVEQNCREWLQQQIELLQPRLLVLSGNRGLSYAGALGISDLPRQITQAHGTFRQGAIGTWSGPVLFTVAVSNQTTWLWRRLGNEAIVTAARGGRLAEATPRTRVPSGDLFRGCFATRKDSLERCGVVWVPGGRVRQNLFASPRLERSRRGPDWRRTVAGARRSQVRTNRSG